MTGGCARFDDGMRRAIEGAGGLRPLARALKVPHQNIKWRTCPREKVFAVAAAAGVDPEEVRPDLANWIATERQRRLIERARARLGMDGLTGPAKVRSVDVPDPKILDLLDLGMIAAAMRFAAGERGLTMAEVLGAPVGTGGVPTPAQSARAYGMGLAVVAGRVSSTVVSAVIGASRQNVDNAAHRYERARDGDDPEDGARVVERGRVRRAKSADESLWTAERRFLEQLGGGA